MKRKRSGKKMLVNIFSIMLIVTLSCLLLCGGYALYTVETEIQYCNEAALDLYMNSLEHIMEDLAEFNQDVYAEDVGFDVLSLAKAMTPVDQRLLAELNLRRLIQTRAGRTTCILVFDSQENICYYWMGDNFLGGMFTLDTVEIMREIRNYWLQQDVSQTMSWSTYTGHDSAILMNTALRKNLYICSMVDVKAYADTYTYSYSSGGEAIEYAFISRDKILTNGALAQERGITLEQMLDAADGVAESDSLRSRIQTRYNPATGIGVCAITSMKGIWGNVRVYVLLLAAALVAVCTLFVVMYTFVKRLLIYPLDKIADVSRQIGEGAVQIDDREDSSILELNEIRTALIGLAEKKVTLEKDNMAQIYQKEHALLQYYQLQTRSHFFLNCLKSIYNLTAKGELEKTKQIITLFSNHMRYVFHDSLTVVPLRAELAEVNDYYRITQLEREDPILLEENVDPKLMDFQVPPLVIQTFLENFNKFNAPGDKLLRFSIRIDPVEMEETAYVRIRLSDNGVGYSEEALRKLENLESMDTMFERYHVGIQNLKRRMDLIYRQGYRLAFFNSPSGGACTVIYLPRGSEIKEETL